MGLISPRRHKGMKFHQGSCNFVSWCLRGDVPPCPGDSKDNSSIRLGLAASSLRNYDKGTKGGPRPTQHIAGHSRDPTTCGVHAERRRL